MTDQPTDEFAIPPDVGAELSPGVQYIYDPRGFLRPATPADDLASPPSSTDQPAGGTVPPDVAPAAVAADAGVAAAAPATPSDTGGGATAPAPAVDVPSVQAAPADPAPDTSSSSVPTPSSFVRYRTGGDDDDPEYELALVLAEHPDAGDAGWAHLRIMEKGAPLAGGTGVTDYNIVAQRGDDVGQYREL